MARTIIPILEPTRSGVNVGSVGTEYVGNPGGTNGHYFINDGHVILFARNASAGVQPIITLTLAVGGPDGTAATSKTVTLALSGHSAIGPFPTQIYNQTDGTMYVDVDVTNGAQARFQAIRVPFA